MKAGYPALMVSGLLAVQGVSLAHGPGGGGRSFEAEAPAVKFGSIDPFSRLHASSSKPGIALSVEGQTISLSISNQYGDPVSTDLAEAKVLILSAGRTSWFRLIPGGGNKLTGSGEFTTSRDMRVDVTLRLPGQKVLNQTFYPLQAR